MKNKNILLQGLSKFVNERNVKKVRLVFAEFHPSDIYSEIKNWPIEKSLILFRLLDEQDASELFSEMNTKQQENIIEALTSEEIADLFEELYVDEAIDILDEMPAKITRKVLKSADKKTRTKINSILRYKKNEIGYHMVVDYISIPSGITIKEAKESISTQVNNQELEIVGNVYVYNEQTEKYVGYITPADIIANDNLKKIDEWVVKEIEPVKTLDQIWAAEKSLSKYNLSTIPVVNSRNKLVGVIELDDIIELYEEVDESIIEHAAITTISNKNYFELKKWEIFKMRIPWIVSLLIVGTLTQIIILGFQNLWANAGIFSTGNNFDAAVITISGVIALSISTALSLSSSINDAAGNAGSQTSSTLVRAVALGEITKENYRKAILKELIVAIYIGLVIMICAFVRIIIVWAAFGYFGGYGNGHVDPDVVPWMLLIAGVGSVSFFITIVIGNLIGAILPIIADKYDIDGAIFSGPVQTTLIDIITILIYFSLTSAIFIPLSNKDIFNSETESLIFNLQSILI